MHDSARRGIVTGGTWCVDHNKLLDLWPKENGRADILSSESSGGGPGFNLGVALKRLDPGLPVATIGLVGDDADGKFLQESAERFGIDASRLATTSDLPTDYTDAFTSAATGQRTHISYFGASRALAPEHFDFTGLTHRILHLGLPGLHELIDRPHGSDASGWVTILKRARAAGLATNLELVRIAGDRLAALVRPCLPHLNLLIVNDHEIGGIAGVETVVDGRTDIDACVSAARMAMAGGVNDAVAVHFPAGAVAVIRGGNLSMVPSVAVPPGEVAGANGAGDAFAAGFLYGWHEGWGTDRCLTLAHAAAAASLRRTTTTGGIEPWARCLALAEQWGSRAGLETAAPQLNKTMSPA